MKFSKVIGKIDPNLVLQAEQKLSKVFLELGVRYDNEHVGSGMGGDPMIFSLMFPVQHICTLSIPTAATNGKAYFWSPKFILKTSIKGLRIVCSHEAWHAIYMHPMRRGSRNPKLWNIAVDYIVNGMCMQDFTARHKNPTDEFTKNLGRFMTLPNFMEMVKNPYAKIAGFEDINPEVADPNAPTKEAPGPTEDRELTPEECKELEKREKGVRFFYADPNLDEDLKRPEKIYDILYKLMPKCEKCGRLGMFKKPQPKPDKKDDKKQDKKKGKGKKDKKDKGDKKDQEQQDQNGQDQGDQHDHDQDGDQDGDGQGQNGQNPGGSGHSCDANGGCDSCGGGVDIFGLGGTVDDHMDSEESEEKMAKRISDAIEATRKLAGHVPGALEDELGLLTKPKISWNDLIRSRLIKARAGNAKNDWTRFRTRPMFSGLLVPKRKSYHATFGCLLDTSGSMRTDDMAYGVSQLAGLDDKAEGSLTCGDCTLYWEQTVKLKKASAEELSKIKPVGRGGTMFADYFTDYEERIGKCDFLVIITDGYLMDSDISAMKNPGIDVYWLITSGCEFKPPFGRSFPLRDM
jgi:predicted metal-dependent peptidase